MSKRSQEKRKARGKEKAKMARRERGMSPLARLAGETMECWMHFAPDDDRMRNISVFREVRGGGSVGAFFLVDYDCIGLKDAFYDLDVVPSEIIARYREESRRSATRFVKVEVEEVRRIVGGAIRWTQENDFRMPAGTARCLKILGGEVNVENADVSEFGLKGGVLNYVGLKKDLESRLVGETLEEFLERGDVTCTFMDEYTKREEEEFEEEEEEEMPEGVKRIVEAMSGALEKGVRKWCKEKGVKVAGALHDAARLQAAATIGGMSEAMREGDRRKASEYVLDLAEEFLDQMTEQDQAHGEAVAEAHEQVMTYLAELGPGRDIPGLDKELARLEAQAGEDKAGEMLSGSGPNEEEEEGLTDLEFGEVIAQEREKMAGLMLDGARQWCFANGKEPHTKLEQAVKIAIDSSLEGLKAEDEEVMKEKGELAIRRLLEIEEEGERAGIREALAQLDEFIGMFESKEEMAKAMGVKEERGI